ncbi:MAG: hypothetical protein WKF37_23250, partial [Bryobacteraceae bacterium]
GLCGFSFFLLVPLLAGAAQNEPAVVLGEAMEDFRRGRIDQAIRGFDRVAALRPESAPELWQRGIALYYAGRFRECRAQFESHRLVNPNDVENAAWHFLCVARAESPAKARAALLLVGDDARVPMSAVLEMFRGKITPERVLAAAGGARKLGFMLTSTRGSISKHSEMENPLFRTFAKPRRQNFELVVTCTMWLACTSGCGRPLSNRVTGLVLLQRLRVQVRWILEGPHRSGFGKAS